MRHEQSILAETASPTKQAFSEDFANITYIPDDSERLQQGFQIELQLLKEQPGLTTVDDYPVKVLADRLWRASSSNEAVDTWQNFLVEQAVLAGSHISGRGVLPHQLPAFAAHEQHMRNVFERTAASREEGSRQAAELDAKPRPHESEDAKWASYRTLNGLRANGMQIKFDALPFEIDWAATQPAFMRARHLRIATIGGFPNSYINQVIHDGLDHWYFLENLQQAGIVDQYSDLFQRLNNPHETNLYSLGGEVLASQIMYVWRNTHNKSRIPVRGVSTDEMKVALELHQGFGMANHNQLEAIRLLSSMDVNSPQAAQLEAMYTGTVTELLSLQRKHRHISEYDPRGQRQGTFRADDPEFIAFVVKSHDWITRNEPQLVNALLNFNLRIEQQLHSDTQAPFTVRLEELDQPAAHSRALQVLPAEIFRWFSENLFTSGIMENRAPTLGLPDTAAAAGTIAMKQQAQ